ncbi:hypothetical protein FQN54_009827 [Arachnomyces sp. PD_36]|nr:hypothetical protein FQN54_009827 [Arachnomyces sp. PD_36]
MSQKTALVTGATGLLGRQVLDAFERANWNVVGQGFTRGEPPKIQRANLEVKQEVEELLDRVRPQVVVHCAANRFPDKCDANPTQARSLNIEATRSLSHATSSRSIFLIYISTDYVFPGTPGEAPYPASAPTNPPNLYGETKRDGENVILESAGGSGVVLRVPVLYGQAESRAESAVNVLVDSVWKAQEPGARPIKMDDWAKRYPTNTEDVGRVCHDIAVKYLSHTPPERESQLPKILQFSSEDCMTKYEICEMFAEILGLPLEGGMERNKVGNEPGAAVQRPFDTHLGTGELRALGINVVTQDFKAWWRRELHAVRR